MADIGTLNPEQMLQQQQILRQQKMAEMLMQQGMQQPQGQMISGHYVAPSIFQNLAGLANTYVGQRGIEKADQAQIDLAKRLRADETAAMADYFQIKEGKPAEMYPAQAGPMPTGGNIPLQESKAAVLPNPKAAYLNLSVDPRATPRLQNMAFTKLNEGPIKASVDDVLLDPFTMKPIYQGAGKLPATLDVAVSLIPNLPRNRAEWTPEQAKQVENKVLQLEAAKASVTHVNMPAADERKTGFLSNILDRNILQMQNALGVDPNAVKPNVPASIVEAISGPNLLSRSMKPAQRQIIEDSQLDVLDTALTLSTGAAYTREQLVNKRETYFPVLGDKPPAVAAKKQRLEGLLDSAFIMAGRATPKRVSAPYTAPPSASLTPPQPNLNQDFGVPAVTAPKFLGFENANR
jgi:hypothetical protein